MFIIIFQPIEIINLGPLNVYTWGLMVSVGIVVALIIAKFLIKKEDLLFDHILNITLISIILGFIGARLLYVFLEPSQFENPIELLRIWDGGLAFYGGLVLAVFGSVIYAKKNKLNILHTSDLLMPIIVVAIAFARIGCLLVNDHLGKLTNLPWGITVDNITRHPISAYYLISLFILFILLIVFRKIFLKMPGFSTYFALVWYSLFRFIIDNFKDFEGREAIYIINQTFLILIFIVSLFLLVRTIRYHKALVKK